MNRNIYNIDGHIVNAENSTDAIQILKASKRIKFATTVQKICNTSEIIPTLEKPEMNLFEIFGNEYENSNFHSLFITAQNSTDAFTKYKENRPKATRLHAKVICKFSEMLVVIK
tara:strand:- start:1298 stop:1639 length:342 start_codon:yes stop_codon:yes gene_type:complete